MLLFQCVTVKEEFISATSRDIKMRGEISEITLNVE